MFTEGMYVEYKGIQGKVSFVSNQYLSILISRGKHRSQDVKIVVYSTNFDQIVTLDSK